MWWATFLLFFCHSSGNGLYLSVHSLSELIIKYSFVIVWKLRLDATCCSSFCFCSLAHTSALQRGVWPKFYYCWCPEAAPNSCLVRVLKPKPQLRNKAIEIFWTSRSPNFHPFELPRASRARHLMKRKKSPECAVSELQELCGDPACEVELTGKEAQIKCCIQI